MQFLTGNANTLFKSNIKTPIFKTAAAALVADLIVFVTEGHRRQTTRTAAQRRTGSPCREGISLLAAGLAELRVQLSI
jgi:hypothetical protein